jgi:hypothetical protein
MSPIRPENRKRYPANWKAISKRIRYERAGNTCECTGQCGSDHDGRCDAPNGELISRDGVDPARWSRDLTFGHSTVKVVLTVAHLDHTPENSDDCNLLAMCQRCHLRYDREHHAATRKQRRQAGQKALFEELER